METRTRREHFSSAAPSVRGPSGGGAEGLLSPRCGRSRPARFLNRQRPPLVQSEQFCSDSDQSCELELPPSGLPSLPRGTGSCHICGPRYSNGPPAGSVICVSRRQAVGLGGFNVAVGKPVLFYIHRGCRCGNFFQRCVFYHGPGKAMALNCPVVDANNSRRN
jgi:hypothetical protein